MKRIAAVLGAVLFSVVIIAPNAMASTPDAGSSWTVVATLSARARSSATSTSTASPAVSAVKCSLELDYPHESTTVSGTVNVHVRVVCTSPVSSPRWQVLQCKAAF